jgi:hypothetical protein
VTAPVQTSTEAAATSLGAASVVHPAAAANPVGAVLERDDWSGRVLAHERRVDEWVRPVLQRHSLGLTDPVEDFLFDYYPYSPAQLRRWSPGAGRILTGTGAEQFLDRAGFHRVDGGVAVDPAQVPAADRRLPWVRRILRMTLDRPAAFHCFGMHEWAMVHGLEQSEVRHASLPLRVSPDAVQRTVAEVGLRCTHFDAYRFFTTSARPLNCTTPTRDAQPLLEQAGCLHATMDLYKYAMWLDPILPAEMKADAFDLAHRCRTVDMQASPYDVTELGLEPIEVETPSGRAAYADQQRTLAVAGQDLRRAMLDELDRDASDES